VIIKGIMTPNTYPKLHLPPDFYEAIGEETIEMKQWFGAAFVEIQEGIFVRPEFMALENVEDGVKYSGYFLPQDSIILAECTLNRIKEVLPELAKIGAFNAMTRYTSLEW
jgi:hypothetical protein